MTEEPNMIDMAHDGEWDVFLSYRVADEPVARALRGQLKRLRPGLKVWAEKSTFAIADGFSQAADEAISKSGRVIALWTPRRLIDPTTTETEITRALTLQKPVLNVTAGLGNHPLPSPFARFRSLDIGAVSELAGRKTGWGPPQRPDIPDLDRQVEPVARWIDTTVPGDRNLPDLLFARFSQAGGWAGSAQFEAIMEALARGDRPSAVEILLNAGYDASRIDQVISPMRLRLADTRHPRPRWGAWRLEPRAKPEDPRPKSGWLWALLGFLACGLLALSIWLMSSVLGTTSAGAATDSARSALLPVCRPGETGRLEKLPCRMPRPLPQGFDHLAADDCRATTQGRAIATPCRMPEDADTQSPANLPPPPSGDAEKAAQTAQEGESEPQSEPSGDISGPVNTVDISPPPANSPMQSRQTPPLLTPQPAPETRASASTGEPSIDGDTPAAQVAPADIEMPDTLVPCETRRDVPCRLTISRTGLWTLSEIAEFYYGTPRAWCRIYRVNSAVFAGRSENAGKEACISLDDTLDLPPRPEDGTYSTNGCPPANPTSRCE